MKNSKNKKELAKNIQKFFLAKKIKALIMKLYSKDDDIDLVVIDKKQYHQAINLLEKDGWKKCNNLSKIRERDKDLFCHKKYLYLIHLHQAFSWNTVTYLDSQTLWKRKIKKGGLFFPSSEDELLIIGAHSLFENKYITPEEMKYSQKLLKKPLDFAYLKRHAQKFNWRKGWELCLKKISKNQSALFPSELLVVTLSKFLKDLLRFDLNLVFKEILNYFWIDWIWNYRNALKK